MRRRSDIEKKLKQDIELPGQVQSRIDDTLKAITQEQHISMQEEKQPCKKHWYRGKFGAVAASLILGVLVIGITAGAVTSLLRQFEEKQYGIEQGERKKLKSKKILNEETVKVTKHGVTIECVETVAVGSYANVLFKVTVPKGIKVNEYMHFCEEEFSTDAYYMGYEIINGAKSKELAQMMDTEQGIFYFNADIDIDDNIWDGNNLLMQFRDLQMLEDPMQPDAEKTVVKGEWTLNIPMKGSNQKKFYNVNFKMKNGATIYKVMVTPCSFKVFYRVPNKKKPDEDVILPSIDSRVLGLVQYEYKNGEVLSPAAGGGGGGESYDEQDMRREGTWDKEKDKKIIELSAEFLLGRVIDVDDITALYFSKNKVELKE